MFVRNILCISASCERVSECVGAFDKKDHGWRSLACIALLVLFFMKYDALECVAYIICDPFER